MQQIEIEEANQILEENFENREIALLRNFEAYYAPCDGAHYKVELIRPICVRANQTLKASRIFVGAFVSVDFDVVSTTQVDVYDNGVGVFRAEKLPKVEVSGALFLPDTVEIAELNVYSGGVVIAPSLLRVGELFNSGSLYAPLFYQEPVDKEFLRKKWWRLQIGV